MISAVYPGTFDPITNGHLDIIRRCLLVFDKVVIGVAENRAKNTLFTHVERVALAKEATSGMERVEVKPFTNLLTKFCEDQDIHVVIRGLRAVSDFEYELQMSQMNRKLDERLETVFMMPGEEFTYVSSRFIREISGFGGDVSPLVPKSVFAALKKKHGREEK